MQITGAKNLKTDIVGKCSAVSLAMDDAVPLKALTGVIVNIGGVNLCGCSEQLAPIVNAVLVKYKDAYSRESAIDWSTLFDTFESVLTTVGLQKELNSCVLAKTLVALDKAAAAVQRLGPTPEEQTAAEEFTNVFADLRQALAKAERSQQDFTTKDPGYHVDLISTEILGVSRAMVEALVNILQAASLQKLDDVKEKLVPKIFIDADFNPSWYAEAFTVEDIHTKALESVLLPEHSDLKVVRDAYVLVHLLGWIVFIGTVISNRDAHRVPVHIAFRKPRNEYKPLSGA